MNHSILKNWCGLAALLLLMITENSHAALNVRVCSQGICPTSIPLSTYTTVGSPQNNQSESSNSGTGLPYGGYSNGAEVGLINLPTGGTIFDSQEAQISRTKSPVQGYPSPEKIEYNVNFEKLASDSKDAAFGYIDANGVFNYNPIKADGSSATLTGDGQTRPGYGSGTTPGAVFSEVSEAVDTSNFALQKNEESANQTKFNYADPSASEKKAQQDFENAAMAGNAQYAEYINQKPMQLQEVVRFKNDFLESLRPSYGNGFGNVEITRRYESLAASLTKEESAVFFKALNDAIEAHRTVESYRANQDAVEDMQIAVNKAETVLEKAISRMSRDATMDVIEGMQSVKGPANPTQIRQFVKNQPQFWIGKTDVSRVENFKPFARYLNAAEWNQLTAATERMNKAGTAIEDNPKAPAKVKADFQKASEEVNKIVGKGLERLDAELSASASLISREIQKDGLELLRRESKNPKAELTGWMKASADQFAKALVRMEREMPPIENRYVHTHRPFFNALGTNRKEAAEALVKAANEFLKTVEAQRWDLTYVQKRHPMAVREMLDSENLRFTLQVRTLMKQYKL